MSKQGLLPYLEKSLGLFGILGIPNDESAIVSTNDLHLEMSRQHRSELDTFLDITLQISNWAIFYILSHICHRGR